MFLSVMCLGITFFFSSRRRHTRWPRDWSSDVCSSDLPSWRTWAMMAWLPLVVAGFGLFHGLVGQRAAGRGWLVAGWLLWLLLDPLKLVFLLLAVADSWMDFRGDRKSTRLNSSHVAISYAVFCLK